MTVEKKISILKSEISKNRSVLKKIYDYYQTYIKEVYDPETKKTDQAIVISDIICNYYTCLETIFLRISQFFENSLSGEKWHQDLLEKMTLRIDGIREAVITEETYKLLLELLKFRHFKRYYFEFDYDWDKLEFIQKKFTVAEDRIETQLDRFINFLNNLQS